MYFRVFNFFSSIYSIKSKTWSIEISLCWTFRFSNNFFLNQNLLFAFELFDHINVFWCVFDMTDFFFLQSCNSFWNLQSKKIVSLMFFGCQFNYSPFSNAIVRKMRAMAQKSRAANAENRYFKHKFFFSISFNFVLCVQRFFRPSYIKIFSCFGFSFVCIAIEEFDELKNAKAKSISS